MADRVCSPLSRRLLTSVLTTAQIPFFYPSFSSSINTGSTIDINKLLREIVEGLTGTLTCPEYLSCLAKFLLVFISISLNERVEVATIGGFTLPSIHDLARLINLAAPQFQLMKSPADPQVVDKYLVYLENAAFRPNCLSAPFSLNSLWLLVPTILVPQDHRKAFESTRTLWAIVDVPVVGGKVEKYYATSPRHQFFSALQSYIPNLKAHPF